MLNSLVENAGEESESFDAAFGWSGRCVQLRVQGAPEFRDGFGRKNSDRCACGRK